MNKINLILPWIVCVHLQGMEKNEIYSSPETPEWHEFDIPITYENLLEKTNNAIDSLPRNSKSDRLASWKEEYQKLANLLPSKEDELRNLCNQAQEEKCTHPVVLFLLKAAQKKAAPFLHKSSENNPPLKKRKLSDIEIISIFKETFPGSEELAQQAALNYAIILPYNMQVDSLWRYRRLPLQFDNAKFQHFDGSVSKVSGLTPNTFFMGLILNILTLIPSSNYIELLDLRNLALEEFPTILCDLHNLKVLVLCKNKLEDLPQKFENFKKLEYLIGFYNKFKKLPDAITKLQSLRVLWMSNNSLENLPGEITQLTSLQELDISFNNFSKLPELPSSLEKLALAGNNLTTLDSSIAKLNNLRALKISENSISSIPESLLKLSSLTYLNLEYCKLDIISSQISHLSNLETLLLSGNNCSQIPRELFSMPQLQKFSIGNDIWEKRRHK